MKTARGFTLIEVLMAVAVLAIALAAIVTGMARYTDHARHLREKSVALWVAHNQLTTFELEPGWPSVGTSEGEAEMAGGKWTWIAEVKETTDPHLRRIDIRVHKSGVKESERTDLAQLSGFFADTGRQ